MRNWAGILPEMLCLICKHVDSLKELVTFGGVCSTWRIVAVEHSFGHPLLPLPWLMLAENQHDDSRDFYSLTEGKIYSFNLPELKGKRCMETKGWIVTASDDGEMALVQPLTRVVIPLPHQNTSRILEEYEVSPLSSNVMRAVISSPPDPKNPSDNCVVAILHGYLGHIGFCKPGDKVWTVLDNTRVISSIEYYRGKFYVATSHGEVWEYDLIRISNDTGHVSPRRIRVNLKEHFIFKEPYLVESGGSLLVVTRYGIYASTCHNTQFWVFEIDFERDYYEEVTSLGTRAIFLGHSATMSVNTIQYPQIIPNSIYFTDDCVDTYFDDPEGGGRLMGVYTLKDKIIRPHYDGKSLGLVCPPVWTFLNIR